MHNIYPSRYYPTGIFLCDSRFDDFKTTFKEAGATNGGKAFKAYDQRVTFATNAAYYCYAKIIKVNCIFHIAKSAGLSARAQMFKIIDGDKNENISMFGKNFLVYGNGGGTAQVFKFTSSNYTDGYYFNADTAINIPTVYQTNSGDGYHLYMDFISFYARQSM